MERITLAARTLHSSVQKAKIESSIVSYQNGSAAVIALHGFADSFKDSCQNIFFFGGDSQRMKRVDTDKVDGRLLDIGPFKRDNMGGFTRFRKNQALFIHTNGDHCDLE